MIDPRDLVALCARVRVGADWSRYREVAALDDGTVLASISLEVPEDGRRYFWCLFWEDVIYGRRVIPSLRCPPQDAP